MRTVQVLKQSLQSVFFLSLFALLPAVQAEDFTVDSTSDAVDTVPGDGACLTAGGLCTLRAAIMEANMLAGADTVQLPAGTYVITIPGAAEDAGQTGDFDIDTEITINGSGEESTIIDGGTLDRLFDIFPGANPNPIVNINDLTLRNGKPPAPERGGAIQSINGPKLTVDNVIFNSNSAPTQGGAIYTCCMDSETVISKSVFTNNSSESQGGAIWHCCDESTLDISDSVFEVNSVVTSGGGTAQGGALWTCCSNAGVNITNSLLSGNIVNGGAGGGAQGGAIWSCCAGPTGALNISGTTIRDNSSSSVNPADDASAGAIWNCCGTAIHSMNNTFSNNSAQDDGGALWGCCGGPFHCTNSTFSGNSSASGGGGALFSIDGGDSFTNSTIVENIAGNSGDGIFLSAATEPLNIVNTILDNSPGVNCAGPVFPISLGHNIDSDGSCAFSGPADLNGVDPLLGPLVTNLPNGVPLGAGSVDIPQTHAPLSGSPAIDAGDNTFCSAMDQISNPRPLIGKVSSTSICDVGAVEYVVTLCDETPIGGTLLTLDELALSLFRLGKRGRRQLKSASGKKNAGRKLFKALEAALAQAEAAVAGIPTVIQSNCLNASIYCFESDFSGVVANYDSAVTQLEKGAKRFARKAKRAGASAQKARRTIKKSKQKSTEALAASAQVPPLSSSCTA